MGCWKGLGTLGKGLAKMLDDVGELTVGWDTAGDSLDGIEDRGAVTASQSPADLLSCEVENLVEEIDGDVAGGGSRSIAARAEKRSGWEVVVSSDGIDGRLGR